MMKTIKLFLTMLALLLAIGASAQNVSKPKKIIIIDGYFFYEKPISMKNVSRVYVVKTPGGTSATGWELSKPLPEKALDFAVPVEQIPEGELLLQLYDEAKKKQEGEACVIFGEPLLKEGDKFPDFKATDIDGETWTSADVKGKIMVLNLWFTGCGPCRAEMPELSTWKDEMPDVMFFSSTYEDARRARPVLESKKFNWIPLVNDTQFTKFMGSNGYPLTVVIDKEGIVAKVEYGTSSVQRAELKEKIQSLR